MPKLPPGVPARFRRITILWSHLIASNNKQSNSNTVERFILENEFAPDWLGIGDIDPPVLVAEEPTVAVLPVVPAVCVAAVTWLGSSVVVVLDAVKYQLLPQVGWLSPSAQPGDSKNGTHSSGPNPLTSVYTMLSCQFLSCSKQAVKFEYAPLFSSSCTGAVQDWTIC